MDRRTFIGRVVGGLLAVAFAAEAQQAARLPRIGVLLPGSTGTGTEVLRQGLRELGYVEGRTAVIEWRWWERKSERLRGAAAEMVRLNPDVIVVMGSEATKAMKEATRSIPIVFSGPSYPVEEGLVESFARPGGNITGITMAQSDHVAKLLQLLLDVAPSLINVGVIWSPANPGSTFTLRDMEAAARVRSLITVIDRDRASCGRSVLRSIAVVDRRLPAKRPCTGRDCAPVGGAVLSDFQSSTR